MLDSRSLSAWGFEDIIVNHPILFLVCKKKKKRKKHCEGLKFDVTATGSCRVCAGNPKVNVILAFDPGSESDLAALSSMKISRKKPSKRRTLTSTSSYSNASDPDTVALITAQVLNIRSIVRASKRLLNFEQCHELFFRSGYRVHM